MAELTAARVHADLEAVRMANVYRQSPMLEGMPIPRYRLPEVTLDIPLAIDDVSDKQDAANRLYPRPTTKEWGQIVSQTLAAAAVELSDEQRAVIDKVMLSQLKTQWRDPVTLSTALQAASQVAAAIASAVAKLPWRPRAAEEDAVERSDETVEPPRAKAMIELQNGLQAGLQGLVIGSGSSGPRISVLARTGQLRELNDSTLLSRVSLTVREDGFEIVKIDRADGSTQERLVPE
jgi:hypothetical protein